MNSVTKHQRYREQSAEHGRHHGPLLSESSVRSAVARSNSARRGTRTEAVGATLEVTRRSPRDDVRSADVNGRKSPAGRSSPPSPGPPPTSPMSAQSRWTNIADNFNAHRRRSVCNGGQPTKAPPLPSILARGRRHSVAGVSPSPDRRLVELTQPLTGSLTEVAPTNKIPFPRTGSQMFMEVLQGFQEELQLSNELLQSEQEAEEVTDTRRRVHFRHDVRLE